MKIEDKWYVHVSILCWFGAFVLLVLIFGFATGERYVVEYEIEYTCDELFIMKTLDDFPNLEDKMVEFVDTFFRDEMIWTREFYTKKEYLTHYLNNCTEVRNMKGSGKE